MLLNSLAIVLWRIDSAIIGMSLYSYATQDWLTGNGGGVWYIMDWLLDTSGLFGLNTWTLFAGLALMLWGLSRIARPFIPSSPVHPGKLLFFFVISYVVISQGSALMQDIESWRLDAGSAVYESIASGSSPDISVPSVPSTSDELAPPADLDGQSPIRGWEAVATSYFLAGSADDIHQPYPPEAFRVAYCLYNPDLPIEEQAIENAQGCSPRNAWDEWDIGDLSILQDVLGIDVDQVESAFEDFLAVLLGDIELDLTAPVPVTVHHPENRELGIRQAQAGVARLALGVVVALFPIVEANIALMLALAASFIYLTLPIILLFGFFLATEPLVNRLLMQFVYVIIRTLIISGIVALFMLLLMNTALSGSLTAYLGLVGVGLVGGFFLARIAAATMKETLSHSLGALGAVWMGSATGLLGRGAAQPARTTMGLAKMGAAAALLGAGGAMSAFDLAETSYEGVRSGGKDLRHGAPGTMRAVDRQVARLPVSLSRLAQSGLGQPAVLASSTEGATNEDASRNGSLATSLATTLATPLAVGALVASAGSRESTNGRDNDQSQAYGPGTNGIPAQRWTGLAATSLSSPALTQNSGHPSRQRRQVEVTHWVEQMYQARQLQRGQQQVSESGRDLLGEDLTWKVERAIGRHSPAEVSAVLETARQVAGEHERDELVRNGRLTGQALTAVRDRLDGETLQAYSGQKGMWDLAALTAVALQGQATASAEEFRQTVAGAESGWGQESPGYQVPRRLRLDPVAAGAHYTAINRFVRLSEEAGLSGAQRERLLAEAQTGQLSDELRAEIEATLHEQREQGQGLEVTTAAVVASALAMPATISGPEQVWTTLEKPRRPPGQARKAEPDDRSSAKAGVQPGQIVDAAMVPQVRRPTVVPTGSTVTRDKGDPQPLTLAQPNLGYALKSSLQDQTTGQVADEPEVQQSAVERPKSQEPQIKAGPEAEISARPAVAPPAYTSRGSAEPFTGQPPPPGVSTSTSPSSTGQSASVPVGRTGPSTSPPAAAISNTPVTSRSVNPPAGEDDPDAGSQTRPKPAQTKPQSRRRSGGKK
jgi:hypothetical protein